MTTIMPPQPRKSDVEVARCARALAADKIIWPPPADFAGPRLILIFDFLTANYRNS